MQEFEVIIVGGGPAGSSCAWQLQRRGIQCAIIDKASFPRHKVCAGWITPPAITLLEIDLEDYAKKNVLQSIDSFETGLIGGTTTKTTYPTTISYGIRRYEFDDYLLQRSTTSILRDKIQQIDRTPNGWVINNKYRARMLIGAGGHFCPVAMKLGALIGRAEEAVVAQEVEFQMSASQLARCVVAGDTPELYFCDDLKGYGWIFRKGDYLNVGLGRQDSLHLSRHVRAFISWLKSSDKIPEDLPDEFLGHTYLLYVDNVRPLSVEGALLIGDAAGLAYPMSGEGIVPAIESGLIAANTVADAAGDYCKERLAPYASALESRFGRRGPGLKIPPQDNVLNRALRNLGRALIANNWFARHVIVHRWLLHLNESLPIPRK